MISELINTTSALGLLGLAIVVYGIAPGLALALIVKLLHKDDPRRRELQAELYAVPRWERPFWVGEQLEVALREGLFPMTVWYWGRWVWHRTKVERGMDFHLASPDTFEVPSDEAKADLRPGDHVRLTFRVQRYGGCAGERMWVEVFHRDGDKLKGTLINSPVFVHMDAGEVVKFHIDDIIDCSFEDEEDAA